MAEGEMARLCLDGICRIFPQLRDRYLGSAGILKTPISYPVYLSKYEEERRQFTVSTGVGGLYSVGRNGEFAHILMEDVYWRTLARTADVAAYVRGLPAAARNDPSGLVAA
jgi:hypothetical protein